MPEVCNANARSSFATVFGMCFDHQMHLLQLQMR
jgi:hypothetical protein